MCQKRIATVVIMYSKNEMYDYILNKKPTRAFVGEKFFGVKFVSKYSYHGDEKVLSPFPILDGKYMPQQLKPF